MPVSPAPVRPRRLDERIYEKELRAAILNPLYRNLRTGLADASAITQVWRAMEAQLEAQAVEGVPIALIRRNLKRIESYHRERLIKSFGVALGVDITPIVTDELIRPFMEDRIAKNVSLIRTIPERFHVGLRNRLIKEFQDAPFDRQRVTAMLREQYGASGNQLRLIARDQTTKTIGQLTEIRQRNVGVEEYRWQDSDDERVRPTHADNDTKTFRWDTPPPVTGHPGHDFQCRCVGIAIIPNELRERLGSRPIPQPRRRAA